MSRHSRLALSCSLLAILIGSGALVGWVQNLTLLKSVMPDLVSMKVNTALSLVLAGLSLGLQAKPASTSPRTRLATTCALFLSLVGLLTLGEYLLGVDFGIDQLLMRAPDVEVGTSSPGRMAPNTAASFMFLGVALLVLDSSRATARSTGQALIVAVLILVLTSIPYYTPILFG